MNIFKLCLLSLIFPLTVYAQNYPQRPIKLVVAYQAGGATDAFARIVAQKLSGFMGQPVVIDNKAELAADSH